MCLQTITNYEPTVVEGKGWKIFHNRNCMRGMTPWIYALDGQPEYGLGECVITDKWLSARRQLVPSAQGTVYTSGFHIYLEKPRIAPDSIHDPIVVPVQYRKARLIGKDYAVGCVTDRLCRVVVADEMFVPSTWPGMPSPLPPDFTIIEEN